MENGQSAALDLSNEQLQVLVSGKFGDGSISIRKDSNTGGIYSTNCVYKEYLEFKKKLLGNLCEKNNIGYIEKNGYAQKEIYTLRTKPSLIISKVKELSIEDSLALLDELGMALWFYDDGSLHKDKLFYNLNTQSLSEEINKEIITPFLLKFGIISKPTIERKKDGREFWYQRISKYEGAFEISQILNKYPINCYNYKVWSSETIQKWSKLQEELKRTNKMNVSNRMKSMMLEKIIL